MQISSEYLSSVGVEQAEQSLRYVVNTLGVVNEPANISHVDLFVDFMAELRMDTFDRSLAGLGHPHPEHRFALSP